MNEIEIRVLDMSAVLKPSDAFALVLEELGGGFRKLALIIGKQEAQAIKMGQMSYTPPRPFTHVPDAECDGKGRISAGKRSDL